MFIVVSRAKVAGTKFEFSAARRVHARCVRVPCLENERPSGVCNHIEQFVNHSTHPYLATWLAFEHRDSDELFELRPPGRRNSKARPPRKAQDT